MPDASRYHRLRLVLAAAGLALSIAYLVALLGTGAAHALAGAAAAATGSAWGQVAIVAGALGATRAVLTLPLGWTRGWWLPRRYGLLHQEVGVWIADQSRKSRTANAAVVGLGRTRRIVLFDTLTARFTPEEIESVLAHELGHHVHGDARRGLAVQGALMLASFWLADLLLRAGAPALGLAGPADPAGMPWLALVLLVLSLAALPLGNGFSRRIERQADDFALAVTGNPGAFIAAMERLGELNLAERRPSRLKELVLYSHPALERRIARARGGLA